MSLAVSKKFCFACKIVHQVLDRRGLEIDVGGRENSHNQVFPWAIPRGFSQEIVEEVRQTFEQATDAQGHAGSHSRQTSGIGTEFDDSEGGLLDDLDDLIEAEGANMPMKEPKVTVSEGILEKAVEGELND